MTMWRWGTHSTSGSPLPPQMWIAIRRPGPAETATQEPPRAFPRLGTRTFELSRQLHDLRTLRTLLNGLNWIIRQQPLTHGLIWITDFVNTQGTLLRLMITTWIKTSLWILAKLFGLTTSQSSSWYCISGLGEDPTLHLRTLSWQCHLRVYLSHWDWEPSMGYLTNN